MSKTEALRSKDDALVRAAPAPKSERTVPAPAPTPKSERTEPAPAPTREAVVKPTRRRLLALALLAIALGIGGWLYLRPDRSVPGAFVTLYGNVDIREVQPAFNDSGPVTRMLVQEGDAVKTGELIATLDDARFAAALAQAEGEMRNQEQVLARLLAGSRPQEIDQAKATMDALEVTYQNDEINYQRAQRLVETGAGTKQQRDDAKAAYDAAKHQYEAARQAYILAVEGPRKEDIAAARAMLEADQGAVALAKSQLADTRLYAPSDGIVEDRIQEPGDMASSTNPVYTIALTSPLWVRAYVPEAELGRIRLGMAATISTDSYPGRVYHGWIGYLSPTSEFTPKTVETPELRVALVYQLRVYVCDARDELRLGMPATVHIDLKQPAPTATPGCKSANVAKD